MTKLARALRKRCPHCGTTGIFASWGSLAPQCPGCGYTFEREEGYWVGAMIVNLGAAQLLFAVILLGSFILTWPDVPWVTVVVLSAAAMVAFPVWFYPRSKTIWVWLDAAVHPYTPEERDWER
ncbi:MAG TPA: DUF983 domain-containing protein [Egibacteraceae bacterium]|nr:DUF983 domain-containing protein [Egibacteraceae bacterium]